MGMSRRSKVAAQPAGRAIGRAGVGRRWLTHSLVVGGAVLLLALVTRLAFMLPTGDRHWPHSVVYEGDAPLWARYAESLQRGRPFEHDLPIHTPGMGYLLAWIWRGDVSAGFLGPKLVFVGVGSLACVLAWLAAWRTCGPRVALLVGLLSATSFGLSVQSTSLNNETPYTFLLLAIVLLTLRAAKRRGAVLLGALAVLHGVAVLLRAEHTLLFLMLAMYLAWRWHGEAVGGESRGAVGVAVWRRRVGRLGAMVILVGGFLLVPLPWNIRSYVATQRVNAAEPGPLDFEALGLAWTDEAMAYVGSLPGFARGQCAQELTAAGVAGGEAEVTLDFVARWFAEEVGHVPRPLSAVTFVTSQGPLSFALANNALAEGGFSTALLNPERPVSLNFSDPRHLRLYQRGYAVGLGYLVGEPRAALVLFGKKLRIFGGGLTQGFTPWNLPLGVEGIRRPVDQVAARPGEGWAWSALLLLAGGAGLFVAIRRGTDEVWMVVLAYKVLVTLAFYGYVRQAVSILPVFFVFVALGIDGLLLGPLERWRPQLARWQAYAGAIVFVLAAVLCLAAGWRTVGYQVSGPITPAPALGRGAFECVGPLDIRAAGRRGVREDDGGG